MKTQHTFIVYTTDGSGFVTYHRINKGFWSYINRYIVNGFISKTTYATLKSNYEFETNIKLPYYY